MTRNVNIVALIIPCSQQSGFARIDCLMQVADEDWAAITSSCLTRKYRYKRVQEQASKAGDRRERTEGNQKPPSQVFLASIRCCRSIHASVLILPHQKE